MFRRWNEGREEKVGLPKVQSKFATWTIYHMVLEQGENENQINKAKNIVEYKFKSIEDNFNLSNNHVCGNKKLFNEEQCLGHKPPPKLCYSNA